MNKLSLTSLCHIAAQASAIIMHIYEKPFEVVQKADHSPVTEADEKANNYIVEALIELTPEIPIVSEEGDKPIQDKAATFWLVDPLDGTRSFVARDDEFTVNIGLIQAQNPALGVMMIPATGECYAGIVGKEAWKIMLPVGKNVSLTEVEAAEQKPIKVRKASEHAIDIVTSKSHKSPKLDRWLEAHHIKVRRRVKAGSALKLARVAEGAADMYPRLGNTMEWDTAAGHAILLAAGGTLTLLNEAPFLYGKEGFLNEGFVAKGEGL